MRRPLLLFVAATLAFACAAGASHSSRDVLRTETVARHSSCTTPPRTRLAYGWPIEPFHRQHAIRGYFGDPRTLAREGPLGVDNELSPGSFTFHNGVDIVAGTGTPVYP